ncbi:MAG: outer membrane lipoprotein carrier protein LolA [Myxococcales bacterium]|nr:outer membrane lipoprotein carrier protein LolA [Myxococcales bacterium]
MLRALTLSLLLSIGVGTSLAVQADAPAAVAVRPADARTVAAQVQAFYDQTRTIEARFVQTYHHEVYARTQRSNGRLVIDKPGRLRFDYDAPNGKVFVSDGRYFTAFEPGDPGEPGQFVKTEVGADAVPGAFAFLTGQARVADYRTRLLDASRLGWSGAVLELVPRRNDPQVRRLILFVDPQVPGVVHRLRIEDHESNTNQFDLRDVRYDREVDAGRFRFSPPAGARRVG